jgi:hypothetical protein
VLGLVTDPSGAVVPGATVEAEDASTNAVHLVTTNAAGRYVFVGLPPGTYSIRATAAGFQQAGVPSVEVEVNKSYTINLQLAIGEARRSKLPQRRAPNCKPSMRPSVPPSAAIP